MPLRGHVDGREWNARWGAAQRYHAAATARNRVLLHLDDDIVPTEPMLFALLLLSWADPF